MKFAGVLTLTNGSDSHAPAEALRAAGLSGALLRDMATASTPRKNAVRRMAPRLPGSSWQLVSRKKCANGESEKVNGAYYSVQQVDERVSWKGGFVSNAWACSVDDFVFAGLMV